MAALYCWLGHAQEPTGATYFSGIEARLTRERGARLDLFPTVVKRRRFCLGIVGEA